MNRQPTLSICIPTRNRAAYLRVLLESIASQNQLEIQVVISDDASSDNTPEVIESFRDRIPNLKHARWEPALAEP